MAEEKKGTDLFWMPNCPDHRQIMADWDKGFVWLHADLFKRTGKWGYGVWARCEAEALANLMHGPSKPSLDYVESNQNGVSPGTFASMIVLIDDSCMNVVSDYHMFFTRLYNLKGE